MSFHSSAAQIGSPLRRQLFSSHCCNHPHQALPPSISQCKDGALAASPVQQHLRPAGQPLPLRIAFILLFLRGLCTSSCGAAHSSFPSAMLPHSTTRSICEQGTFLYIPHPNLNLQSCIPHPISHILISTPSPHPNPNPISQSHIPIPRP